MPETASSPSDYTWSITKINGLHLLSKDEDEWNRFALREMLDVDSESGYTLNDGKGIKR